MSDIYYYEGETEKKLISALKNKRCIPPAKPKKFNFWERDAASIMRNVNRNTTLYIVFDTDVTDTLDCQRFISNITKLHDKVKSIILIAQHRNLEDELCYACSINGRRRLFLDFFDVSNGSEFKSHFTKESNLFNKLEANNFNLEELWSRKDIYSNGSSLETLSTFSTDLEKNNG